MEGNNMADLSKVRDFLSPQLVSPRRILENVQTVTAPARAPLPADRQQPAIVTPPPQSGSVTPPSPQLAATAHTGDRINTFVTAASLATFPVASAVIVIIWKLIQVIVPNAPALKSPVVPLIISLIIGAFLYVLDLSDPKRATPLTTLEKVGRINTTV
jgi:hypothetical protein